MSKCECGSRANCSCRPDGGTAVVTPSIAYSYILEPLTDTFDDSGSAQTIPAPYELVIEPKLVLSPTRMDKLMQEFFKHLTLKCQRKNKAYAETDVTSDALNNFREVEKAFGIDMMLYAEILKDKHRRAWQTYVRTGEAPDKAFRILGDMIVYALIQYCIAIDQGLWDHEMVLKDDD